MKFLHGQATTLSTCQQNILNVTNGGSAGSTDLENKMTNLDDIDLPPDVAPEPRRIVATDLHLGAARRR